jgi:hypothetical protein
MKVHARYITQRLSLCGRASVGCVNIEGGSEGKDATEYIASGAWACGSCQSRLRDLRAYAQARRASQRQRDPEPAPTR